jgi:YD repeat-containing protein
VHFSGTLGAATSFTYDAEGNQISVTDATEGRPTMRVIR